MERQVLRDPRPPPHRNEGGAAMSDQAGKRLRRLSLRDQYGDDIFPLETVVVFRRAGNETRSAVKVAEGMWRVTGCWWLRRWDGVLRTVGNGYDLLE